MGAVEAYAAALFSVARERGKIEEIWTARVVPPDGYYEEL